MPRWIPEQKWLDVDAFIIGGGDSLRGFDFNLLKKEMTIGCNAAFLLGEDICKLCLIGDIKCFNKFNGKLSKYKGIVFTNAPQLLHSKILWLWTMGREGKGLHKHALGWNNCTGFSALNLALILGANPVYLLGFDMKLSKDGKANWHNEGDKPNSEVYTKFLANEKRVAVDLKNNFSTQQVINITDDSALTVFPKIGVKEFWEGRRL